MKLPKLKPNCLSARSKGTIRTVHTNTYVVPTHHKPKDSHDAFKNYENIIINCFPPTRQL